MTWSEAMTRALRRSQETGRKWYVRGYQRTISHYGEWLYGAYSVPDPDLAPESRPNSWWKD
jgi:hypothetical protein